MDGDYIGITYILFISAIIIGYFVWVIRCYRSRRASKRKAGSRRIGSVHKLDYHWQYSPLRVITIFEIHTDNGEVFYAGVEGVNSNLDDGAIIEFWPTKEIIVEKSMVLSGENRNGYWFYRDILISYFRLEEYAVISKPAGTTIYIKENNHKVI